MSSSSGFSLRTENNAHRTSQPVHFGQGLDIDKDRIRRPLRPKSKAAPPANYPVRRSPSMGYGLLAAWCLAAFVSALWVSTSSFGGQRTGLAGAGVLVSLLLSAVAAYWGWVRVQTRLLRWDGKVWRIQAPGATNASQPAIVVTLRVHLDLQFLLLLRLEALSAAVPEAAGGEGNGQVSGKVSGKARGSSRWIWLDQSSQPGQWPALRRAVFSPKPPLSNSPRRALSLDTEGVA